MKNVRTVQIEELSKEQIEAARMRRRKDRSVSSIPRSTYTCYEQWVSWEALTFV